VGQVCDQGWREGKLYLGFVLVCSLITLLNPYGVGYWNFIIQAIGHDRSMFPEWSPVTQRWAMEWPYFLPLVLSFFSLLGSRLKRTWADISLLVFAGILAFFRSRLGPFLVTAAWILVPKHFEDTLHRLIGEIRPSIKRFVGSVSFGLILYGLACVFYSVDPTAFDWDWRLKVAAFTDPWHIGFPVDVVQYMKKEGISGNAACPLTWGGFLFWEMPSRIKVSLDGRWDTIYPQNVIREGMDFEGGIHWQQYLEKYKPDMVLAFKGATVDLGLSKQPEWSRCFAGREGVLFIRKGSKVTPA